MTAAVVVTAVDAEAAAVLSRLTADPLATAATAPTAPTGPYQGGRVITGAGEVVVLAGGIGPARAAACAATAVAAERPGLLVIAGIGGGFAGRAGIGDVVIADLVVHADLGADSAAGFLPISELGFGPDSWRPAPDLVTAAVRRTGGRAGPILTVSTVTGTAERAADLDRRHSPAAEGMEGAGGWAAAERAGLPFLEIRAISNLVGPRDRDSWDLPAAFGALGRALADLLREPLP